MGWMSRLLERLTRRGPDRLAGVECPFPGWREVDRRRDFVAWQNEVCTVLSLAAVDDTADWAEAPDEEAVREMARGRAESRGAGLVEASIVSPSNPRTVSFIYKMRLGAGFRFTGQLIVVSDAPTWIWTVVDGERSITGVREAAITARMFADGTLTPERYETDWAGDPYRPDYAGVEPRTLRYLSDDRRYDDQFPDHPLSRVRRALGDVSSRPIPPTGAPDGASGSPDPRD